MSPQPHANADDEMRPEYDFSHGVRGTHYEAYRAGTNVVFLDSDLAAAFPDSASVNRALRLLVALANTKGVIADQAPKPGSRTTHGAQTKRGSRAPRS